MANEEPDLAGSAKESEDTEKAQGADHALTSVMPRWLVVALSVFAALIPTVFLVAYFGGRVEISSPMDKIMVCIGLAFFLSVFFFVFYPQRIVVERIPGLDWVARLSGPVVLMLVFVPLFKRWIPDPPPVLRPPDEWTVSGPDRDVYLFDGKGEKYDKEVSVVDTAGETRLFIPLMNAEELKNVERHAEPADESRRIYVKSAGGTYLGFVDADTLERMEPADRLRLGVYFGTCQKSDEKGQCVDRRNGRQAHELLLSALQRPEELADDEREEATNILYFLMSVWFRECSQYEVLVSALNQYPRTNSYRLHMLAETYLDLSRNRDLRLTKAERIEAWKAALAYYLRFVGRARGRPEHLESSRARIDYLLRRESISDDLRRRISTDLEDEEAPRVTRLAEYADEITFDFHCPDS